MGLVTALQHIQEKFILTVHGSAFNSVEVNNAS